MRVLRHALLSLGMLGGVLAASVSPAMASGGASPVILPPNAKAFGASYAEWSARWWQWNFSLPVSENPSFDQGGCDNGANGQTQKVWFLTGVINTSGSAERTCSIPVGRPLFVPVLNVECSTVEGNGATEPVLRACTDSFIALATGVFAQLDGHAVQNVMGRFRTRSPFFTFGPLPESNVLGVPAGSISPSVGDGFYLLVAPLTPGPHTLHFGGTFGAPINFTLDITYHLNVGR